MTTMIRRLLALCACALVLAACQVDVSVDLTMAEDGTGTITVVATADADVVRAVPTIADELALEDVVAAGWAVEGPTATPDGGVTVSISHPFTSAADATNLLNSIGPPFNQMAVARTTVNNDTTNSLSGLLGLSNGFESFADEDLVTAVGSLPFADEIAASDATPETSLNVTMQATLPGVVVADETNGEMIDGGAIEWIVPMDGSIIEQRAQSEQSPANNAWWARPLSIGALVLLIAWVAFMTVFIGYVAYARSRRARRYKKRPRPTSPSSSSLRRQAT
jgi:hypothetical protein